MLYKATTRKKYFQQQLSLSNNLITWFKYLYYRRMFRIDYSESEIHSLYHLWKTAKKRRRTIIMSLMYF
jgi:hypothetical protein